MSLMTAWLIADQDNRKLYYVFMLDLLVNVKVDRIYHSVQDSFDDGLAGRR